MGLGRAWLQAAKHATYIPTYYEPLPPVGVAMYGAVYGLENVLCYDELYYQTMLVRPHVWPLDSDGHTLTIIADPMSSWVLPEIERTWIAKCGHHDRADMMLAQGWLRVDREGFQKSVLKTEIIKKNDYYISSG